MMPNAKERAVSQTTLPRLLIALLVLVCCAYILAGTALVPFHGDESTQILMSRDYAYQFLQGDFARLAYDPSAPLINETQLRLINGTLNKYLIGLSWHVSGFTVDDLNTDWDWALDYEQNVRAGHVPSDALLVVSRVPSALFLAAGVPLVFAIGWLLGSRWIGALATVYYTLNPGLLINGRRAMMEGTLTFFSLLCVLAGIWFARKPSWGRAALLGVAAALTIASKHTGAFVVIAVFGACGLVALVRAIQARKDAPPLAAFARACAMLIAAAALAFGVFYALNPGWWGADIPNLVSTILEWRQDLLQGQTELLNGYMDRLSQAQGFAQQVFQVQPQYFEVWYWSEFIPITEQIARYEASPWAGISIGGSDAGGALVALLMCVGIFALLRDPDLTLEMRLVFGVWGAMMVVLTLLLTPVEWQRYYLPIFPFIGLLAAYGPLGAARWWRRIRAERAAKQAKAA
jgi:4-amino-4-deoxy-L-arabinose transferase-like glycosyltransferase